MPISHLPAGCGPTCQESNDCQSLWVPASCCKLCFGQGSLQSVSIPLLKGQRMWANVSETGSLSLLPFCHALFPCSPCCWVNPTAVSEFQFQKLSTYCVTEVLCHSQPSVLLPTQIPNCHCLKSSRFLPMTPSIVHRLGLGVLFLYLWQYLELRIPH